MSEKYVGVDIGGTKTLVVLVSECGAVAAEKEFLMKDRSAGEVFDTISNVISGFEDFNAVGVGIAGDVDFRLGKLRVSPNLPGWKNISIRKILSEKIGKRVAVDNDANCAAVGSYYLDGKKKYSNFLTVTLGTGIGGGIIIDNKLYRGSTGSAGEVGHITINHSGHLCACGNYGCLEAYIGTSGIRNIASEFGFSGNEITPACLAAHARSGNKEARKVYEKFGYYLAVGLGGLINVFNPDMITLSGGVSNNYDLFSLSMTREIKKRSFAAAFKHVRIKKTDYARHLGAIGAALITRMELNQ